MSSDEDEQQLPRRSGRVRREPAYLKAYVRSQQSDWAVRAEFLHSVIKEGTLSAKDDKVTNALLNLITGDKT